MGDVVFYMGGIGDGIMAVPAMRAAVDIARGKVTLVCNDVIDCVAATVGSTVMSVTATWTKTNCTFDVQEVVKRIGRCDRFISLVDWHCPALGELIAGLDPAETVGMFGAGFGGERWYETGQALLQRPRTASVAKDPREHAAVRTFSILRSVAPDRRLEDYCAPIEFSQELVRTVSSRVQAFSRGRHVLAIHVETLASKSWVNREIADFLSLFLEAFDDWTVLFLARDSPERFVRADGRVAWLGSVDLIDALITVTLADAFIGVDSSMLHMADLARVPSVGLFGPTSARRWGFFVGPNLTIQAERSMSEIQARHALAAIISMIGRSDLRAVLSVADLEECCNC